MIRGESFQVTNGDRLFKFPTSAGIFAWRGADTPADSREGVRFSRHSKRSYKPPINNTPHNRARIAPTGAGSLARRLNLSLPAAHPAAPFLPGIGPPATLPLQ